MNSHWTKNLIIFTMALVITCSDGWIKIRISRARGEFTPDQTWLNLVKAAKNL